MQSLQLISLNKILNTSLNISTYKESNESLKELTDFITFLLKSGNECLTIASKIRSEMNYVKLNYLTIDLEKINNDINILRLSYIRIFYSIFTKFRKCMLISNSINFYEIDIIKEIVSTDYSYIAGMDIKMQINFFLLSKKHS